MAKHEYYAVQGKTLDNIAETMKTVLGVDKDTPIRFDEITNNEKVEQVTESVDVQAEVIEQIKAALNGKSSIGVKEIMDIIDQSGVLDSTDGTATEKVEALIEKVQSGGGDNGELRGLIEDTLKEFSNNEITTVRRYAFVQTQILEKVDLPNVVTVGAGAFSLAPRLKEVNLPLTTSCGTNCFYGCAELLKYNLPKLQVLSDNMFSECVKLKIHDLHSCTSIGSAAFKANLSLTAVTLRNNSVVALSHIIAFGSCPHYLGIVDATYNPEGLKDGYIYVPRKLISSYQTATNWSSLYAVHENVFRALEDYTVDGTITGALDESKI